MDNPNYDKNYYNNYCSGGYENSAFYSEFFGFIADRIIENYHPSTVLDAGCALGYLVSALRERGVAAYGIDISGYAIAHVSDSIKPYCFLGSLVDPLPQEMPQHFDLVTTIEVLEHLDESDGALAIERLCSYTDRIIFSSTPDDYKEPTHVNVQKREYWARLFIQNGFFDNLSNRPTYITYHAVCYQRVRGIKIIDAVGDLEEALRKSEEQYRALRPNLDAMTFQTIYIEVNGVFSEEKKIVCRNLMAPEINIKFTLPEGCHTFRFDPVEGERCAVRNLTILAGLTKLDVVALNGVCLGTYTLFDTKDPQFLVQIPDDAIRDITISAYVHLLSSQDDYLLAADAIQAVTHFREAEQKIVAYSNKTSQLEQIVEDASRKCEELEHQLDIQSTTYEEKIFRQLGAYKEQAKLAQAAMKDLEAGRAIWNEQLEQLSAELLVWKEQYTVATTYREEHWRELESTRATLRAIETSHCWKITKPIRVALDTVKHLLKSNHYIYIICKGIKSVCKYGPVKTFHRVKSCRHKAYISPVLTPVILKNKVAKETADRQLNIDVKFSILVPLFNTPERFLVALIESVLAQNYDNWELCLADGSTDRSTNIAKVLQKYRNKDDRIKYKKLSENRGIAGNTLAAYEMATGNYYVLADHDDLLTSDALYEVACAIEEHPMADFIYSDRGIFNDADNKILAFHYLPGYSPEFLRSCNYASHLNVFSKAVVEQVGFLQTGFDGSQDYDFELRVIEKAREVVSVPKVLYYCRACEGSVALDPTSKMYAYEAGRRAIEEHIERIGYPGKVEFLPDTFSYRIHYKILKSEKVSIIIPNMNHAEALKRCVSSILGKTDYPNYEILIVENNSSEQETFDYYKELTQEPRVRVMTYQCSGFNYSALNNYAVEHCSSSFILFLNNDTEVISSGWLTEMMMFAQREDVGAVGAKLYYPDGKNQHVGLMIGLGGHIAAHPDWGKNHMETGYMHRLSMPQNYNAVTAACMLIKKKDFERVAGFDHINFKVSLNDVDLCLKLRQEGLLNVVTPYAELYHYESLTRGSEESGGESKRAQKEQEMFRAKWKLYFKKCDAYANPQFPL